MKEQSGAIDCDTDSPMRMSVRKKGCSTNQADLDPTYIELGDEFRDITELLFEREMELISHVFALPQLPTVEDPSRVVYDFRIGNGRSQPIYLTNGQVMVVQKLFIF